MNEGGATHIFLFGLASQKLEKNGPDHYEILSKHGDLTLNQSLCHPPLKAQLIETSLASYLSYLYVEYPSWVRIKVNGVFINLKNPYSILKSMYPQTYKGDKQERFAVQFLDDEELTRIMEAAAKSTIKVEGEKTVEPSNEPQPYFS